MFCKFKPPPSASFVIHRVPNHYTEKDIKELFKNYLPLESVIFHNASPHLAMHIVTVTFPTLEAAQKAASMIGKHVGNDDLKIQYSFRPNNLCQNLPVGSITSKEMHDDEDVPNNNAIAGHYIHEWRQLEEVKPDRIPQMTKYLGLRFNCISSFEAVCPSLTEINLKGNDLVSFPSNLSFPLLQKLDISFNLLTDLPDFLTFAPSIEKINATTNKLKNLHPSISKLIKLVNLDVSHNQITYIPELPPTLKHLLVQSNQIDSWADMPPMEMHELSLWKNQIKSIPGFAYGNIDQVCICHNCLTEIPIDCLINQIKMLDLCMNNIRTLPPLLFKIKTLEKLILYRNEITEVPIEFSTSYLVSFDISENPIGHLPVIPYQLNELKINFCEFEDLTHCIKMNSLTKLHAISNHLKTLPSMPEITELLVPCNELTEFPVLTVTFMQQVVIDVSFNKIKSIPPLDAAFRLLDVSHNEITEFPKEYFNTRSYIYLSGNPITAEYSPLEMTRTCYIDISNTNITLKQIDRENEEYPSNLYGIQLDYSGELPLDTVCTYTKSDSSISAASMIGTRSAMEDCLVIRKGLKDGISIYALFDGHHGARVSRNAAIGFPEILAGLDVIDADSITRICNEYHEKMIDTNETGGSTMDLVTVFENEKRILVSHIGDTKVAIYGKDGSIHFQTHDQNAYLRSELERLRKDQIRLRRMRTGGTLAMSRALGDILIAGVSHQPEHTEIQLTPEDKWLVIACDGIVDDLDLKSLGKTLVFANSAKIAATLLRDQAYSRGSEDNISAIVVDLGPLFK